MQRTTLIIFSISIAAFVAAVALVVWLQLASAAMGNELSSMLQTIRDRQQNEQEQRVLADLLASTASERSELQTRLIQGETGVIQFLSRIDQTALRLGVDLETSELDVVPQGRAPYDELSIRYSFSGSETSVRALVRAFETVPYAKSVRSLDLTKEVEAVSGRTTVTGSIELVLSMIPS